MKRIVLISLWCLAACSKGATTASVDFSHRSTAPGTPVATFNGQSITDAELSQRFAEMSPYARARYQTVDQRREYLDGLVRFELLAAEAVRQGLANEPDIVEQTKRLLVQALLKKELDEKSATIPEADVAAYYQAHQSDYVKPGMTRLAHIFVSKAKRTIADEALKKALALKPHDIAGFTQLVSEYSEDERTKLIEGDLRFLSDADLAAQFGQPMVDAASALKVVGDIHPSLIETEQGFHVISLRGRQVPLNLSQADATQSIQQKLAQDRKMDRYRELLKRLREAGGVKFDEARLAGISIDVKAPSAEPKGPPPGFIPPPSDARER